MLIFYAELPSSVGIQELTEPEQGVKGNAGFPGKRHRNANCRVEHPGRDFQAAAVVRVQPAVVNGLALTNSLIQDEDVAIKPGMKRVADATDIDQRGRVLMSFTVASVRTRPWTTGPPGRCTKMAVVEWCRRAGKQAAVERVRKEWVKAQQGSLPWGLCPQTPEIFQGINSDVRWG
jgi:hypothetical protein